MRNTLYHFILLAIALEFGIVVNAQYSNVFDLVPASTKRVSLPNGETATLKNNGEYKVVLKSEKRLNGQFFLFEDRFYVFTKKHLVFEPHEKELIEKGGIQIDNFEIDAKDVQFIHDTILFHRNEFYLYEDIKAVNKKGIRSSTTFKRLNFGFNVYYSPLNEIESFTQQMNSAELNDSEYWRLGDIGTTTSYPNSTNSNVALDLDVSAYINPNHGVRFLYTLSGYTVRGFREMGREENEQAGYNYGIKLSLTTQQRTLSLVYNYSLKYQRINLFAGPSFLIHKINEHSTDSFGYTRNTSRKTNEVGLLVGGSYNLVNLKSFFLNVKAYYQWFGNVAVGPYYISDFDQNGNLIQTTFETIEISPQAFHLGAGLGFKL
ncbi:MAG: hypothetical protein N4A46_06160 [Schleiferiaceae bacterium]|nr:hypothetical protein [Schleiferiaceae bacterium]